MKLLLQGFALVCSCLLVGVVAAQPIRSDIDPDVQAYYERECSADLTVMLKAFNDQDMNGPATGAFYMEFSRLDAAALQQRAREYLEGPGQISRRWGSELDWVTNVWQNCLLNAREKQLALPLTRFTSPTRPLPPEDFRIVRGPDGEEDYIKGDGSKCIRVQSSQSASKTRAGYFDQWANVQNECNRELEARVCKPDGTCMQVKVPANTINNLHLLGTTQGLAPEWDVNGRNPQQNPPQAPVDTPQEITDTPQIPVQTPAGGGTVVGPDNTPIDFGDDGSDWANNGSCDDPRFSGPGTAPPMLEEDYFHDASDCRALLAAGRIEFTGYTDRGQGSDQNVTQDQGNSFGLDDALGVFREVVDIYADYQNTRDGLNGGGDDGTYPDDSGYDEGGDSGGDDDDCPYNRDSDPETVCTVQ